MPPRGKGLVHEITQRARVQLHRAPRDIAVAILLVASILCSMVAYNIMTSITLRAPTLHEDLSTWGKGPPTVT